MLAEVAERSMALRSMTPADRAEVIALHSVALAASASLTDENIASLVRATRAGRLPRRGERD
jgi:hypothetical protein